MSQLDSNLQSASGSIVASVAVGRFRWAICALLFSATAINYVDRQIIGVLKPTLQHEFGWSEIAYGDIVFWFQAAYAAGYLGFGRFVDRIGARLGYAAAVAIWTAAHVAHAFVHSLTGFTLARVALGLGESGNFPGGVKAVTDWFPKKERALAIGVFNAGANVGAIITPLIVPAIALTFGWRAAFLVTGTFSLVWLAAWLAFYRHPKAHKQVSAAELAFIESDPPDPAPPVSWISLLRMRETWMYAGAKFLIDPIWWMFLFWLPDFFAKRHHLDLRTFGPPLVAVYVLSDIGSVVGGLLSSEMMKRGLSVNASRKTAMLIFALLAAPVAFASYVDSLWLAVAILGLATAAHQGFSANVYTLPSDLFPRKAVATVIGIGGAAGGIGGMLMAKYAGWILDRVGDYTPIFALAAGAYLVALAFIHLMSPRLAPAAEAGRGALADQR
jgi:ACS family hexuronate transporter-like MFS transporter